MHCRTEAAEPAVVAMVETEWESNGAVTKVVVEEDGEVAL